ncbi:glutamate receptor ionotropic, NMDA 1-like [Parasteatoda tepidariorum]|uniref:glutamate receptor ionotropic, NMDA 1-like n=1 Tax=Parasteatoda tepidariorum TaxID=114398 RepID=UPI0039BCE949
MCDIKNITVSIIKVNDVLNVTTFSDGRYELRGFEGKFLQLLLDFLSVNAKFKHHRDFDEYKNALEIVNAGAADIATSEVVSYESFVQGAFSNPYCFTYFTFVIRKSVPISTKFAFIYPFTFETWLGLLIVFPLLPLAVIKIFRDKQSYTDLCFRMFGTVLKQAVVLPLKSLKSRLFFLFWLFFTMVISFSYSAVFFSFMVNPLKNPPVRNYEELSDAVVTGTRKSYMFYTQGTNALKLQSNEKMIILAKEMDDKNYYIRSGHELDFREVLVEGDAFSYVEIYLRLKFGTNPNLFICHDEILPLMIGYYFRKHFCLEERINTFISRALSAGLYQKVFKEVQMKIPIVEMKDSDFTSKNGNSIHLQDISGVLILLFSGYIFSFFVLIIEIFLYKYSQLF